MKANIQRKWVLKALENGAVGTVGHVRSLTVGASKASLADIEKTLVALEAEGLAARTDDIWRSSTRELHFA